MLLKTAQNTRKQPNRAFGYLSLKIGVSVLSKKFNRKKTGINPEELTVVAFELEGYGRIVRFYIFVYFPCVLLL